MASGFGILEVLGCRVSRFRALEMRIRQSQVQGREAYYRGLNNYLTGLGFGAYGFGVWRWLATCYTKGPP